MSNVEDIEDYCLDNYHAVRYSLIEDRAYPIICTKCQEKIQQLTGGKMIFKLEEGAKGLYKVTTQHGTYYEIDLDEMTARRVPAEGRNEMRADNNWFQIRGMDNVEVGKNINFMCRGIAIDDWYTWRQTTNVTSIEEIPKEGE